MGEFVGVLRAGGLALELAVWDRPVWFREGEPDGFRVVPTEADFVVDALAVFEADAFAACEPECGRNPDGLNDANLDCEHLAAARNRVKAAAGPDLIFEASAAAPEVEAGLVALARKSAVLLT